MTALDVLRSVRDLLTDRHRWCQDSVAMTVERDKPVDPTSITAACWCLSGALLRHVGAPGHRIAVRMLETALWTRFGLRHTTRQGSMGLLAEFNDRASHAAVISLLGICIATQREAE